MTRLAVLSDIHGNLPALEAVLADLSRFEVDRVVVTGDLVNCGPFSEQVVRRVVDEGWAVVRGNSELYLLDYGTPRARPEWADFALLPWLQRQLDGRWRNVIAGWPDTLCLRFPDAPPVRVAHGSPRSAWSSLSPATPDQDIGAILADVAEDTVVVGHTHLAMDRQVGRWHVVNAGTVGLPTDGIPDAGYLLLDGDAECWRATFRRVPYDREALLSRLERSGIVESCGVTGQLIVEEFRTSRLQLLPFQLWRQAAHPGEPAMALLDEFRLADRWAYTPAAYHVNRDLPRTEDGVAL